MNALPLYEVAGKVITVPRLAAGLILTVVVTVVNYRGIRLSGRFQNVTTLGLLACFGVFTLLGFARGSPATAAPLFADAGPLLSTILVLQIVPYFMTGFESVAKGSEEARVGFDPRNFGRAITLAVVAGSAFYVLIVGAVSFVYPWRDLVGNHLGTEAAFARAFGSRWIAQLILVAAFLSLFKVMNGNFVAATRMLFALGRRGLVHPSLGAVHARFETPRVAIVLMAALTAAAAFLGDALLVPVTEVGSLAAGVGWLSACAALVRRGGRAGVGLAIVGAVVSLAIVAMKVIPGVPGSFSGSEWIAFAAWCALGAAFWMRR
jgi:amino acid transporter